MAELYLAGTYVSGSSGQSLPVRSPVTGEHLPDRHSFAALPGPAALHNLPESPMIAWPSRRPRPLTATAMVLLGVAGCGGEGQTDPSDVTEITLDNDQLALDAAGQARQLNATARDADGSAVNVTIEWSSSEVDVVTVEGDGLLVAQHIGEDGLVGAELADQVLA